MECKLSKVRIVKDLDPNYGKIGNVVEFHPSIFSGDSYLVEFDDGIKIWYRYEDLRDYTKENKDEKRETGIH